MERSVLHSGVVLQHVGVRCPQDMDVLVDLFLQQADNESDPAAEVDILQLLKDFRASRQEEVRGGRRVSTPSTRPPSATSSTHSGSGLSEMADCVADSFLALEDCEETAAPMLTPGASNLRRLQSLRLQRWQNAACGGS